MKTPRLHPHRSAHEPRDLRAGRREPGRRVSNVLMSRLALKQDEQRLDDQARCRAALLETPGFDDVEAGGDIHLPWRPQGPLAGQDRSHLRERPLRRAADGRDRTDGRRRTRGVHRDAHAAASHVVDPGGPPENPRRSAPAPRTRARLQGSRRQLRLHQRAHARGKKLVPSNPGAKGAAARPPASTAPGGKNNGGKGGAPGKGAPAPSRAPAPAPRPAQ
jgi:hypothetical protein